MLWIGIYFLFFDVPALSHNLLYAILWKWAMRSKRILVSRAWTTALSALSWTQWRMIHVCFCLLLDSFKWRCVNTEIRWLHIVCFNKSTGYYYCFTCSCPTSCSERKRAKSSLFPAEARKLFQSDGNGTSPFSITLLVGLLHLVRLILVPDLMDTL